MTTAEFLNEICDVLGRDPDSLTREDTPKTVKEWDSMGHLTIIATVDDLLEVSVEDEEMRNFQSIGELLDRLNSRSALEG